MNEMNLGKITPSQIDEVKKEWILKHTLIGATAACKLLGCSLPTLNRMVDDGDLTVHQRYPDRSGSPRMFLLADIDRYIVSIKVINNYE